MTRNWSATSVLAAALALTACNSQPQAEKDTPPRSVTVSGDGFVLAKPDLATVTVGVTSMGDTANLALAENNTRMAQILQAVSAQGIPESDVQTSDLALYPRYGNPDPAQPNAPQKIVGYTLSNAVTLTVRDLAKLGGALDQFVTAAGANSINGLSFGFANPTGLQDDARRRALEDARRKAELYATAVNAKLGAVREVSEEMINVPMPVMRGGFLSAKAAEVPIAEGTSKVSATVRVVYALE